MTRPNFTSLPDEYQYILQLVQERHNIKVIPLEELKGGRTGAYLYLVSVTPASTGKVAHFILKLDRVHQKSKMDEIKRHRLALSQAPPDFARQHLAEIAFEVAHEGYISIFYTIAGQSLIQFHPLAYHERQNQLETIFTATNDYILKRWNIGHSFEQAVHPHQLLNRWLGHRLKPEGNIGRFLEEDFQIAQETGGLLIQGELFPNPLAYGQELDRWGGIRLIDIIVGFQHGDLNIGNILVKFVANERDLDGYFLIDFSLYKSQMPLLYDLRYLELSYLLRELERASFQKWVDLVTTFASQDMPNPQRVPVELAGVCGVVNAGRMAFGQWVQINHASLGDDLWGQFWLAAVAAGLNFCNKLGIPEQERLAGLIYAAAHLKRFCNQFGLLSPTEVRLLYDASQPREPFQTGEVIARSTAAIQRQPAKPAELDLVKPTGTVTFLFTDIVGSTALWETHPKAMINALALHDELLEKAAHNHRGYVFKRVGDSFCMAFHSAIEALEAAVEGQRVLKAAAWDDTGPILVRMGLHSGIADEREGDYFGPAVNRVARLQSIAHGGQILLSQATLELARDQISPEYKWLDLGQCPLKDLSRPEHVYQLLAPDLPADFPPLIGREHFPSSLPEQATSFVGRRRELAQVNDLLENHRLVTLCGPGGIGKSRLALAVAEAQREEFRHGVRFVPLLPIDSPKAIAPAIANVLGLIFLEGRSQEEQLLDHIQSKQMLLVLDNMEHLLVEDVSGDSARETLALIERMLATAPGLTILVTSRELLRLSQEEAYPVQGLPVGDGAADTAAAEEGAMALFLQRAERIQPAFARIDGAELQQVYRLCRLVEGMPLAIELAAAQLRLLSLASISAEIEENLDVLASGLRGTSARHSSMRVVFEASWHGLKAKEQRLFARLSAFRGGFSRQAAAQIAQATVMDLATLIDKSLIRRDADGRFDLHPIIQMFVSEKLAGMPEELTTVRERHYHFYRNLLHEAIGQWRDTYEPAVTDALKPEVENIRDGWRWILSQGDWAAVAVYVGDLWQFLKVQGRLTEAIELLTQTALAGRVADPPASLVQQAHWERLLGQAYLWLSKMDEGADHFQQTLSLLGWPLPQGNAGFLIGVLVELVVQALHRAWPSYFVGRLAHKHSAMQESIFAYSKLAETRFVYGEMLGSIYCGFRFLNQAEAVGMRSMMAQAYSSASFMFGVVPVHRVAQAYLNWAESMAEDEPSPYVREWVSRNLGFYLTGIGQFERAEDHLVRGAKAAAELGQYWNVEFNWVGLLCAAYNKGEYDRSLEYARRIGASASKRGDASFEAAGLYWQALVKLRRGDDVPEIIDLLQESASAPSEVMNRFDWIVLYGTLAHAYLRQGHVDLAIEVAEKVFRLVAEISHPSNIGTWYGFAGVLATYQDLWEKYVDREEGRAIQASVRQVGRYVKVYGRIFPIAQPRAWLYRGLCDWLAGRSQKAHDAWQKGLANAQELSLPFERGLAHYEIGRHLSAGQVSKSGLTREEHLGRAAEIFANLGAAYNLGRVNDELDQARST